MAAAPLKNIRHFTASNPGLLTLEGTNQYLLGRDEITVVDVALPSAENIQGILEQVEAMGGRKIEKILLTHIHADHSGGALELRRRTGARLGLSRLRAGYLGGEDFTFGDGERLAYDGGELHVVHTPGHESGHCCFYEAEPQALFTGDHILGRGTTVIPPPDGDMSLYIQSLEKLLKLEIRTLLPGHGPAIGDPAGKIREYIDHRRSREREVVEALGAGRRTIPEMVEKIYAGTPRPLLRWAGLSVEAHLIKLEREGRVRRDGERYLLAAGR